MYLPYLRLCDFRKLLYNSVKLQLKEDIALQQSFILEPTQLIMDSRNASGK